MKPQRAAAAFRQHIEVATRLCRFDDAEAGLLAGDVQIGGVVRRDLQKHTVVRPAFIGLSGGMEEARAESDAGSNVPAIADRYANGVYRGDVGVAAVEIGEGCNVVARLDAGEMRLEPLSQIATSTCFAQCVGVRRIGVNRNRAVGCDSSLGRQFP